MTLSTAHTSANAADAAKIVITGVADVFLQQLQISAERISPLGLRGSSPRPHHAGSCWGFQ